MRKYLKLAGKAVVLTANLMLVMLWLAGYAAAYVSPDSIWWFQLVAIALPYLTLAVTLSGILFLILQWWPWFALQSVILVLAAFRFIPFAPLFHDTDTSLDDLTLMTFNMRFAYNGPTPEAVGKRFLAVAQQAEPDVVALQEAWLGFRDTPPVLPSRYIAPLIDSLGFQTMKGTPEPWNYTEQPVLAKATLLSQENIFLDLNGTSSLPAVRAVFMWKGQKVVLYNVHLQTYGTKKPWAAEHPSYLSPAFWKPYLVQYKQAFLWRAQEAKALRAMIQAEEHPVIVSGDFNETRHNWAYNYLREDFRDAFQTAGSGWGLTYHAKRPFTRIDHILVDEHWDIISAQVIKTNLSDHRPVVAHLRLQR